MGLIPHLSALCLLAAIAATAHPTTAAPLTLELPDDAAVTLEPGEGLDTLEANCQACHSLDYIVTQPPQMGDAFWAAEVKKMIEVMHAEIEPADAEVIVKYLQTAYGG